MSPLLGFLDGLGTTEMFVLGVLAILLFGEKLPEVARTWGKKIVDFKRNIQGIQDELRSAAFSVTSTVESATDSLNSSVSSSSSYGGPGKTRSADADEDREEAVAPKFVPPPAEPKN
jgi:sec-independent protein translocase protein TatA